MASTIPMFKEGTVFANNVNQRISQEQLMLFISGVEDSFRNSYRIFGSEFINTRGRLNKHKGVIFGSPLVQFSCLFFT